MQRYLKAINKRIKRNIYNKIIPRYILNHNDNGFIKFIDIGSVGGLPEPWDKFASDISYLLNFEPNDAPKKTKNSMTYNTAVWSEEAVLPFYIYKGFSNTGSSLFEQNFEYVEQNWDALSKQGPAHLANSWVERSQLVKEVTLKCRALDDIFSEEFPENDFHFVKIDTQGAEFEILQGADKFLSTSCVGLHMELFRIPLYKNIKLMEEVQALLEGYGFELLMKYPAHGTFKSQNDCVFIHKSRNPKVAQRIREIYQNEPKA